MNSVSVVTPSKNQAQFLQRAVDSVLTQRACVLDYTVVDAASGDGTLDVLRQYGNRLRWISEPDRGLADAVNKGFQGSNGEIIGWLNSDDVYFPGAINAAVAFFERNPEIDVVYGDAHYVDEDDDVIGRYSVKRWNSSRLKRKCFLCQPAVFFRRRVLDRCGYLNTELFFRPDYEFWLRLDAAGARFAKIDQVLAGRRIHAGNKRGESGDAEAVMEMIGSLQRLKGRVTAKWYVTYGQMKAEAEGIDRESRDYDSTVLKFATEAIERVGSRKLTSAFASVLMRHWHKELTAMVKRPYFALRLLPAPIRVPLQEHARRKLFRLSNYRPRPLRSASRQPSSWNRNLVLSISIVTPSLNQGRFLQQTLSSVVDQDYPLLEYVVQDGGSTDQSVGIIQRHEQHLASWQSAPDGGQANAINLGFARTSGEIMAYLNSDDLLLPDSLAYVSDYFRNHEEVDVIYGHRLLIDEQGREVGRWVLPPHDDRAIPWADYIPQETMFWRRRAWEAVGSQLDESFRFAMDWDLILRFRDAEMRFARVPRFLGAFRVTKDQKTKILMETTGRLEMKRLRRRVLGRIPSRREIRRAIRPYLRRQAFYDKMYSLRLVRY